MQLDTDRILENARALAPRAATRADEIAKLRRLPADLVADLKAAGVFRMPMPAAWGGPEMSPRAQNEVVEILSAADASTGWCTMIGSDAGFWAAFLERLALARAEGLLGAARAYSYETMDRVREALRRAGRLGHELRLHLTLSRVDAFETARDVAQLMIDTAGWSSIYASSPLDRLLRDAITVRTHLAVQSA
jgi:alkylation response protein AidB-like acyl-CoA dehydrogenase